jgi:hypothetical protein
MSSVLLHANNSTWCDPPSPSLSSPYTPSRETELEGRSGQSACRGYTLNHKIWQFHNAAPTYGRYVRYVDKIVTLKIWEALIDDVAWRVPLRSLLSLKTTTIVPGNLLADTHSSQVKLYNEPHHLLALDCGGVGLLFSSGVRSIVT